MITFATVTLLLTLTLAWASPTPKKRSASVFPIKGRQVAESDVFDAVAVDNERALIKAKYGNLNRRTARNHVSPTIKRSTINPFPYPYDVSLHRRADSGSGGSAKVPLLDMVDNGIDVLYYGALEIGTPPQNSTVVFDTGSSDLVIPVSTCTTCVGKLFDSSASSTFHDTSKPFSIEYASLTGANGTVAMDQVTVAGLTVPNQAFGAVTNSIGNFTYAPNAGILGLGFPDLAQTNATPFFINLVEGGALASNIFSFWMVRGGKENSELCIGCLNSDRYSGGIDYYPLDPSVTKGVQLVWNIASTGFAYGGEDGGANKRYLTPKGHNLVDSGFSAIIDSGTTFIYASYDVVKAFYDKIPGSKTVDKDRGIFSFPCDTELGSISIGFGSKQYAIDRRDFNRSLVQRGSTDCVGGIIAEDLGNKIVVGDEFMKSWYSVFDYDRMQVGFAQANQPSLA